ncbi:MAG: hypothetical protein ACXVI9_05180 [Mucilaginibacter sp.]
MIKTFLAGEHKAPFFPSQMGTAPASPTNSETIDTFGLPDFPTFGLKTIFALL